MLLGVYCVVQVPCCGCYLLQSEESQAKLYVLFFRSVLKANSGLNWTLYLLFVLLKNDAVNFTAHVVLGGWVCACVCVCGGGTVNFLKQRTWISPSSSLCVFVYVRTFILTGNSTESARQTQFNGESIHSCRRSVVCVPV